MNGTNIHRYAALVAGVLLTAVAVAQPALLELEPLASGLDRPLGLAHAGDGSGRLFLLEQAGRVRIYAGGELAEEPFLDLSDRVRCCNEQGLLGLAFHPDFSENGFLYVDYTASGGETVVSRFRVSADPDRADPDSEVELLRISQPFANHNGGHLAFGPDGHLYVATGDGGSGGDPMDNAQSLETLLGKILRIDVDSAAPYAVPGDNPFVDDPGALGEIWAYGLRNPWRFSFDRATGDLYIGDVGQGRVEEIDFQPASSPGGENYGWRIREGDECFRPSEGCRDEGLTPPVLQYGHDEGCSVTGGYRYRGGQEVTVDRFYLFGDFCSGRIWGGRPNSAGRWRARRLLDSGRTISSFGEDEVGEVYLIDYSGELFRIVGRPLFADGFDSGGLEAWSRVTGGAEPVEPGLDGSAFALAVPVDGTRRKSFARSNRPQREETLELCFLLSVDRLELEDGGSVEIARLRGSRTFLTLDLERWRRGHRAVLRARGASGFERVGATTLPRRRPAELCVDWSRATSGGSTDGEASLSKAGRVRAKTTGLDNRRDTVRTVHLGLPGGSTAARSGGRLLFDDVVITP